MTLAGFTALDCSSESKGSPIAASKALPIAAADGDVDSVSEASSLLSDVGESLNPFRSKKSTSSARMLTKEPATQPTVGETTLMAPKLAKTKKA